MTVEDLRNWADSLKEIPDNHDQVFTVSEFKFDLKSINFHIFMTTRRLISFTRNANHIATDATYKLLWLNFPILLCGTTDANKAFHPFGMLITKNETENDFTFMFKTVRDLSLQLYQWQYSPTVLIADAAQAITNGFKNVFELNKRITCWAHVERKIKERTNGIREQDLIKADFNDLQSNVQEKHFDIWLSESNKGALKPTIETKDWTFAYEWLKLGKRIVKYTVEDKLSYMFTSSKALANANKEKCKDYFAKVDGWTSFEEYLIWNYSMKCVNINLATWESSICSCYNWKKDKKCKHTIGVSYFLGLNDIPGLDLNIEGNSKREYNDIQEPSQPTYL
ncbi:unnamed protein product [Brachionus calyciflorus]|uniref:SWIM-type domain-containing protein n=1 Tax=Brachionus calyciflorus TaxID=104777 RepID=A0A814RKQ4_9BILA|nr:unnamed protein product [Brachionus calyciflorus]